MTISEVCEKCDVSQDTLRYYENHCPLGGQAGIRVYAPKDLGVALPWQYDRAHRPACLGLR